MRFYKYQAGGNDFIVLEPRREEDWSLLARRLCTPCFGIGADGLIVVCPSDEGLEIRLFNPDGSEAEVSGNGLACAAKFAQERKISHDKHLRIKTKAGVREVIIKVDKVVVNMGRPIFHPKDIPVNLFLPAPILDYPLEIEGENFHLSFLSLGNPHAVLIIDKSPKLFPLEKIGPKIENHPLFPKRINFEVAQIISENLIKARVWERGAGETLSCGSGACAIAITSHLKKLIKNEVDIKFRGGVLGVVIGEVVWLKVGVYRVFWGEV